METDLSKLLSAMSDDRLQEYINKREKYNTNAVLEAIEELKKRGRVFSDPEIEKIKLDLEQQQLREQIENKVEESFYNQDKNTLDNLNISELYSERVIYIFSILFSVLFGSMLMAINIRKAGSRKGMFEMIAFGFLFSVIELCLLSYIPASSAISLVFSIGGALIINNYFWKKYIGKETEYRKRQIVIPLAIGISISVLFILLVMYGQ